MKQLAAYALTAVITCTGPALAADTMGKDMGKDAMAKSAASKDGMAKSGTMAKDTTGSMSKDKGSAMASTMKKDGMAMSGGMAPHDGGNATMSK